MSNDDVSKSSYCVYVCACVCACACVYACVRACVCMCVCVRACVCAGVCMYACLCISMRIMFLNVHDNMSVLITLSSNVFCVYQQVPQMKKQQTRKTLNAVADYKNTRPVQAVQQGDCAIRHLGEVECYAGCCSIRLGQFGLVHAAPCTNNLSKYQTCV